MRHGDADTVEATSPIVETLITSRVIASPRDTVSAIAERFFAESALDALALIDGTEPVGLVTRHKLMNRLFRRFGHEIYGRWPIIAIADTEPLIIAESERLDVAIDKALCRSSDAVYDELICVGDNGCFRGLLSMRRLVIEQGAALANSMLQKEVATRQARELEKINEMKSQFIANVTHELRSPVNAIIGLAELLRMSTEQGSVEKVKERLAFMLSSATNLRTIITNILDLSKIDAGKMDVIHQQTNLSELILEIAETTRILIGQKPVSVELLLPPGPVIVMTDSIKARQILLNLASNAAKFTEAGTITIQLDILSERLRIMVTDTGLGIKEEHQWALFSAFSQVEDAKTKRQTGTGLGLAISKSLASLLGGSLSMVSEYGAGSCFILTLPNRNAIKGDET